MISVLVVMRKIIFPTVIICSILLLTDCKQPMVETRTEEIKVVAPYDEGLNYKLSFRNPAVMAGSDLLLILRRFYVNQDYRSMLLFTSRESINQFGERSILKLYRSANLLGPDLKLVSLKYAPDSLQCSLKYSVIVFSTKNILTVNCMIENDTAKISLCNLKSVFCN
jgi:hypothetical protein